MQIMLSLILLFAKKCFCFYSAETKNNNDFEGASLPQIISAIDIGSNAIRMIVAEVNGSQVRILKKFRAPVRLGKDTFMHGEISAQSIDDAKAAFDKFSQINKKFKVEFCRAIATSAVRESKNKDQFIAAMLEHSKINIKLIDGTQEAELIHLAVSKEIDLAQKRIMLIDVGGGSVEIIFSEKAKILATQSFPMGTVRILDILNKRKMPEAQLNVIMGEFLELLANYIHSQTNNSKIDFAIGTGGNLECMGRLKVQLLKKTPNTFVTLKELGEIIEKLKDYSVKDRILRLEMKADRADVILPACMLIQTIMRQAEVEKIMIPCVGLRDGILWSSLNP